MSIKEFLIKKLGGITRADEYKLRKACQDFAMKHLRHKDGYIIPDAYFYKPFNNDKLCVLRSDIQIMNGVVDDLIIAPWCKQVSVQNIRKK